MLGALMLVTGSQSFVSMFTTYMYTNEVCVGLTPTESDTQQFVSDGPDPRSDSSPNAPGRPRLSCDVQLIVYVFGLFIPVIQAVTSAGGEARDIGGRWYRHYVEGGILGGEGFILQINNPRVLLAIAAVQEGRACGGER